MKIKMKKPFLIMLVTGPVFAAPLPGHPTVEQAAETMSLPRNSNLDHLPNHAKVLQSIQSNDYVYIEVQNEGGQFWLAAPAEEFQPGDAVRYSNGTLMQDFYSKKHQRTFDAVWFVSKVEVISE
jgi:hypothetical protein